MKPALSGARWAARRATRAAAALALMLLALGACRDGTGPEVQGASVRIYIGDTPYDERTVPRDTVVLLSARVFDPAGKEIAGQAVSWSSTTPGVASVDGSGIVQARTVGTARIIASSRAGADTARINVAERVTGQVQCQPGSTLSLEPGQAHQTSAYDAVVLCLPGGEDGAEYTLIPYNAASTEASTVRIRFEAGGLVPVAGPPLPLREPIGRTTAPAPVRDVEIHQRLRERASRELEPRLRAGTSLAPTAPRPARSLGLGDTVSFNVDITSVDGCSVQDRRAGRVAAVTQRAIVVADQANPAGGFSDADYERFGRTFDDTVWPLMTATFGEPSDIDGNGRVIIFFTRAVNELSPPSASYVAGFFFNRDLFAARDCEGSNVAEMFYMMVPDPDGQVGTQRFSRAFVERSTLPVLAHEFQHLINDSRRLHVNNAPVWEETWLNEGLSHIAEELIFFHRAGVGPRKNLGPADFPPGSDPHDSFDVYQRDNYERWVRYARAVQNASLMGPDGLATRGATWSFLRYAADRRGPQGEAALWWALVRDTRTAGLTNLRDGLGVPPHEWIHDWATAMYMDDTGLPVDPARFRIASWNFRALAPAVFQLWGITPPEAAYPLFAMDFRPNHTVTLRGGGAAFLRAGVAPGETASIRTTVGGLPAPSRVRLMVVRTR